MNRPHQYLVICLDNDVAARPTVVSLFSMLGDGGSAESLNCQSVLWNGSNVPVAKCCEFTCTEQQYQVIAGAEGSMPSGVKWVRSSVATGLIATTNIAGLTPGTSYDTDAAIVAAGLKRPVVPIGG